MKNSAATFEDAIRAAGMSPPACIFPGRFHRFPGKGKGEKNKAGWCMLFLGGTGGVYGDFSAGMSETWQVPMNGKTQTIQDRRKFRELVAETKRQADLLQKGLQEKAAQKASHLWVESHPADEAHPYLVMKGIKPHGIRQIGNRLIVPISDPSENLCSVQYINEDGGKQFLSGGRIKGCSFLIGSLPEKGGTVCIAEGFATGASIHEATRHPVIAAFNAGNLREVAMSTNKKLPDATLIICSDDDCLTEGNPGITKASEAAKAVGGLLAIPDFGNDRPEGATDFNDLHQHKGSAAVKACIDAATVGERVDKTILPTHPSVVEETIRRLADLSPFEYDRERKAAAKTLGVRPSTLDSMVQAARQESEQSSGLGFQEQEPWPDPVDPAALLSEIAATVRRFIICSESVANTVTLWIVMTWFVDVIQVAPLAIITAPEKRCGKSQLLALMGNLVRRPLIASNITAAAMFRTIEKWKPTMLVDEADAFMRDNEELRGVINSGHTRDTAYVIRLVGDNHEPKQFSTWGAKALAGIGRLPDTIQDRGIILELRRRLPHEKVARLRYAEPGLFETLSTKLCRLAQDYREEVRTARPKMPRKLNDRAQDNWEPLLAIAEVAGEKWPRMARHAALKLSKTDDENLTIGTELLADIRDIFNDKGCDKITTAELIAALCMDEEKPWATYNRGNPIKPRQVSKRLAEYGIRSSTIRDGIVTAKGYKRAQFEEAFSRYLPPPTEEGANNEFAPPQRYL
jgi:putative DNA primase/helicase